MIALLGKHDTPTDGINDYCNFLGQALARRGFTLTRVRVSWDEEGWTRALRRLWRDSADWRGEWVLLQYTALTWSRRGFPYGVLAARAILRKRGARCAVVFHEHTGFGGSSWRERIRHACQMWIVRTLYRGASTSIFTIPLDTVGWLPSLHADHGVSKNQNRAVFIRIGANIPECTDSRDDRTQPMSLEREKRVVVYGVRGAPATAGEVSDIAEVAREASKAIPNLCLVVLGRGSSEVREDLASALEGCSIGLEVRGVLPAEEIVRELRRADALLFVRSAVTPQRGGAIAGIACGLPIVGYGASELSGPLAEAGIEWAPWRDQKALARALVFVLTDSERWVELHERNVRVHEKYFSWNRIAELYIAALAD
jgi:glycosyltransferase involved in cell wall biosynthesis